MLKSSIWPLLLLCATTVAALGNNQLSQQQSLVGVHSMLDREKLPGHNDAVYITVPKEDQLFHVEFLEIAPTPIIADRIFFVYLRGSIPEFKKRELGLHDRDLFNATVTVSSSAQYSDGSHADEESITIPLKTIPINDVAHLMIRDAGGRQVDYLPSSDQSDIILDFGIPTTFLKSGMWTFKVDARVGDKDNTCLFAMSLTQWLEGHM